MIDKPSFVTPDLEFFNSEPYALLLPGQGVQKKGMGWELIRNSPAAWKVFYEARDAFSNDEDRGFYDRLLNAMFSGTDASFTELTDTSITQPAIVLFSYAMHIAFFEAYPDLKAKKPAVYIGHSLGEITALALAGVVNIKTALKIAKARGQFMKEAGEKQKGAMLVLVMATLEDAEKLCSKGICIANDNCRGEIVLSGEEASIDQAALDAAVLGIRRTIKLPVSVAAHSPLMESARVQFAAFMKDIPFGAPNSPMVLNGTAEATTDPAKIKQAIISALTSRVRFRESIEGLGEIKNFVEIGSDILSKMTRRISSDSRQFQVNFG